MEPSIVAKECRFAVHIPAKYGSNPDIHLIKEQVHYSNGEVKPAIKLVKDFKRDFYVTLPAYRNHQQKKEWEDLDKLMRYECTESELRETIARALEMGYSNASIKKLSLSPYLYGSDITSTSLIKKRYMDKYPDYRTPYTVAVFDIETKKVGTDTIIVLATIAFNKQVFTGVLKSLVQGIPNVDWALNNAMNKYLPQYKDQLQCELKVFDNEVDLIKAVFEKAHQWSPDILTAWNINYDFPRIFEMLQRHRVDPREILCDPTIPKQIRICKYKEGKKKKITASGKVQPISPASQWHTLHLTAGFYVLDAMCVYKQLRISKGEQPSYSLDAILRHEEIGGKLSFTEADEYSGIRWHHFMQENYPIEYIVYNRYDCLSILDLDNKTKDLCIAVPEFAATTDFSRFNSQPKKIADALYFYLLEHQKVIGCVGFDDSNPHIEFDDSVADEGLDEEEEGETLGLHDWIVTLPSSLQVHGLELIEEDPALHTNIRTYVFDADVTAAYPTCTSVCNVSKETTYSELIDIHSIPEDVFRLQNINLMAGPINALQYCTTMFNFPKPDELLKLYRS